MPVFDYLVERLDGDYAYLRNLTDPSQETILVARALLPEEIEEGSRLHYEFLQYTLM